MQRSSLDSGRYAPSPLCPQADPTDPVSIGRHVQSFEECDPHAVLGVQPEVSPGDQEMGSVVMHIQGLRAALRGVAPEQSVDIARRRPR